MKVTIPISPWKGDHPTSLDEAAILCVFDRWHQDSPGQSVHRLKIGDVEILCRGFTLQVKSLEVFMTFTVHNILEKSWDAYVETYGYEDCMEGSGRLHFVETDDSWEKTLKWWPGCDLIIPITEIELLETTTPEVVES